MSFPLVVLAQWPLKVLTSDDFVYEPGLALLSKVKYTSQGQIGAVFNQLAPRAFDDITIDGDYGDRSNYKTGQTRGIYLLRDAPGSFYSGSGNQQAFVAGSYSEYGVDFETDPNDNFILLGNNVGNNWNATNTATAKVGDSTQILLCKTGDKNNVLWYKLYGGSNAEYAVSIQKAGDGNFIVLAQTQSNDGDVKTAFGGKDIWLFKIDTNGNMLWQKTLGSNLDEIPTHMEVLKDGSIMISGSADASTFAPSSYSGKNAFLSKLTSDGNIIWTKVFGGNGDDKIKSFITVPDGFVSIGTSTSADGDYPTNLGQNDIYIIKHNVNGNIVWEKHYGDNNDDQAGDIVYTPCDDKVYASFAKQYNSGVQYFSNPPYPLFSQNTGVQLGLYNGNGTEFYYFADDFYYDNSNERYYFNKQIYNTLAANDRGGFLAGGFKHMKDGAADGDGFANQVGRTFHIEEYGVALNRNNYDTSLCQGASAYGATFTRDTAYADTLRNSCNVDTLISKYTIKVTTTADSLITKDTTVCYGQSFGGTPVTASFIQKDTLNTATPCGFKKIITVQTITVPPVVNGFLGNDTILCKEGLTLQPAISGASFLWQDGSTASSFQAAEPGKYWVQVSDPNGCHNADTINIAITDLFLMAPHDTTIDAHKSVLLTPSTNGTVIWQFNSDLSCEDCPQTIASPTATTTYYLTAQKDGCLLSGSLLVTVKKEDYFYLPNAFTPNGDGLNDVSRPIASGVTAYTLQVYNRWGQRVFETGNVLQGWNGKVNGVVQPNGVYVYRIAYQNSKGQSLSLNGTLVLIQ